MAVHSHAFHPYAGPRTARWARPLVLTRYALRDAFAQKKTIALLVVSAIPTLLAASIVYLHHNLEAIKILEIPVDRLVKIDALFFFRVLKAQALTAFLLTVVAGPRMLIADLRDNALPLYLSRPLTRLDYVLGKAAALFTLGSLVTWVPLLLLVGLQVSLSGFGWLRQHWIVLPAVLLASWLALALFTLVCLAIAALVRRRAAAEAAVVGFFFVLTVVSQVVIEVLRADWGIYLSTPAMLEAVWVRLFALQGAEFERGVSIWAAALALAVCMAGASLLLERRVRAWEVVR